MGGYKVATQDPDEIERLFSHARALELAVPMGEMSGLMCIDVDVYKFPELEEWLDEQSDWLNEETLVHETRSGGYHFFFEHPGDDYKFPAQLRPGVDIKASGTGYVCWPGTAGYTAISKSKPQAAPIDEMSKVIRDRGGAGDLTSHSGSYNCRSDDELVQSIISAADLYPALRTLSMRLVSRGTHDVPHV